jgi:hypothetical protein
MEFADRGVVGDRIARRAVVDRADIAPGLLPFAQAAPLRRSDERHEIPHCGCALPLRATDRALRTSSYA